MLVLFQNKLIYMGYLPPGSRHEEFTADKIVGNLNITEQTVQTPDRKQLKGFAVERKLSDSNQKVLSKDQPQQKGPIIIYFQGNAGNMIHRFDLFNTMLKAVPDATILGICLRGFGSSSGRASERGLEMDAESILHHVYLTYGNNNNNNNNNNNDNSNTNKMRRKRPIYIYGHSLGGAVAIGLLAKSDEEYQKRINGLIIENTYTSILDMVKTLYPRYTPYPLIAKYFLWNHWPSSTLINNIKIPILFLSSEKDEIVPVEHMEELYTTAASSTQCTMVKFPRSTHMDIYQVESGLFKSAIRSFINSNNNK